MCNAQNAFKLSSRRGGGRTEHMKGLEGRVFHDLVLVVLLSLLTVLFVLVPPLNQTPLRIVLGLCFVLFLPGYALVCALFPKKDELDGLERIALSFGLSIAIVPLTGLVLNYTPFGIRLVPVLFCLAVLTIGLCVVAHTRRIKVAESKRFDVDFRVLYSLKGELMAGTGLDRALSIALVIAVVLAVLTTAYVITAPKQGERFTEFYVLGEGGKAAGYPSHLMVGQEGTVIVGVVNHEYENVTYTLEVRLNGAVLGERSIRLSHGEKWERPVTFVPTQRGENQKLEFLLYRDGEVYRSLHLWVNVS